MTAVQRARCATGAGDKNRDRLGRGVGKGMNRGEGRHTHRAGNIHRTGLRQGERNRWRGSFTETEAVGVFVAFIGMPDGNCKDPATKKQNGGKRNQQGDDDRHDGVGRNSRGHRKGTERAIG